MKRTAVIMAGGSGERFWPLSRKTKPKQLLSLASEKIMLRESLERIESLIPSEDVFIITGSHLLEPIRRALPELPPENVVAEPVKRNTAPCLALAAAFIAERYSGEFDTEQISIAVLTADQAISPDSAFLKTVESALSYVENNPAIAIIGIPPDRPETGYGYVEIEANPGSGDRIIDKVLQFHEKPDYNTAVEYVKSGNFLWNSGMFFWRLDTFINQLNLHLPRIGEKIPEIRAKYKGITSKPLPEALDRISGIFEDFPDISLDYGLMEKAAGVVAAKAFFKWDDIGSWDSLERYKNKDDSGNIIEGNAVIVDSNNNIIINSTAGSRIIPAILGMENIVLVISDDALLICPKNKVQDVKKCVNKIRGEFGEKYL